MRLNETVNIYLDTIYEEDTPVGIFNYLNLQPFNRFELVEISLEYYLGRSGFKLVSPLVENLYKKYDISVSEHVPNMNELLAKIINNKYSKKWDRVYEALSLEYEVLDNINVKTVDDGGRKTQLSHIANNYNKNSGNILKSRSGSNGEETEYGLTITNSGVDETETDYGLTTTNSGTDKTKTEYNSNDKTTEKTGKDETIIRNNQIENDVYGFNSSTPVGDDVSTDNNFQHTTANPNNNTKDITIDYTGYDETTLTHGKKEAKSGTDTTTLTHGKTETKSGIDTITITIQETDIDTDTRKTDFVKNELQTTNIEDDNTNTKTGRDVEASKLLDNEIMVRIKNIFLNIVFDDIDSIMCLQIY